MVREFSAVVIEALPCIQERLISELSEGGDLVSQCNCSRLIVEMAEEESRLGGSSTTVQLFHQERIEIACT